MVGSRQFLNFGVKQQSDDLSQHREGPVPHHEEPGLLTSPKPEIFGGHGMITKAVNNWNVRRTEGEQQGSWIL